MTARTEARCATRRTNARRRTRPSTTAASTTLPTALTLTLTLTLTALAATLTPAPVPAAAPPLTALNFLPGDDALAPAIGRQSDAKIAAGGNQQLVVWVDDRTAFAGITTPFSAAPYAHHAATKWDIYGARLDADGNLVDQTPIMVSRQVLMQIMPDVAWNGENWLVVWAGDGGLYECCTTFSIYAARVSPSGEVLDDPPIEIDVASTNNDLLWPTVGSDGTNWVVVWRDLDGGIWTLDATRVAPDGTVLDPGGVFVRHDTFNSYPVDPDIVWAGDEYLLTWEEGSGGVRAQRLTADLQKLGPVVTVNATSYTGFNPSVATDGTDFFVAWSSRWPGQVSQLDGARISHDGVILDVDPLLLTDITDLTIYEPSVAWDGTNYVVAFDRATSPNHDLYAIRVSAAGQVLDFDTASIVVSNHPDAEIEADIAVLPAGGTTIVWRDTRYAASFGDLFAAPLTPDGQVGAEQCVALGAPRQTHLRVVPNGTGYLAVYRSETSPETRVLAQRLDANGNPIDVEPVVVTTGGNEITNPAVAWNGSVYLVVWENAASRQTYGRRLDAGLALLDPAPFFIVPGNWPDVAAIGDLFATVTSWEEPHEVRTIVSVRIRGSDGAVLDATPQPIPSGGYSVVPRVSVLGNQWLVVRQVHPTHDDPNSVVRASFVDVDNVPGPMLTVDSDARNPDVIGGPDHALIVLDGRNTNIGREIYGRRILANGTFLDPVRGIAVSMAFKDQFEPAVAWDGNEYVTAFHDFRDTGNFPDGTSDSSPPGDIYGARVAADGTVIDPQGFVLFAETVPERFPAMAGQAGMFVAGGSVFRPDDGFANYRIGLHANAAAAGLELEAAADGLEPLMRVANTLGGGPVVLDIRVAVGEQLSVGVYDVTGRKHLTLFEGRADAGAVRLEWDRRGDDGRRLARGVYFVRAQTASEEIVARVIPF